MAQIPEDVKNQILAARQSFATGITEYGKPVITYEAGLVRGGGGGSRLASQQILKATSEQQKELKRQTEAASAAFEYGISREIPELGTPELVQKEYDLALQKIQSKVQRIDAQIKDRQEDIQHEEESWRERKDKSDAARERHNQRIDSYEEDIDVYRAEQRAWKEYLGKDKPDVIRGVVGGYISDLASMYEQRERADIEHDKAVKEQQIKIDTFLKENPTTTYVKDNKGNVYFVPKTGMPDYLQKKIDSGKQLSQGDFEYVYGKDWTKVVTGKMSEPSGGIAKYYSTLVSTGKDVPQWLGQNLGVISPTEAKGKYGGYWYNPQTKETKTSNKDLSGEGWILTATPTEISKGKTYSIGDFPGAVWGKTIYGEGVTVTMSTGETVQIKPTGERVMLSPAPVITEAKGIAPGEPGYIYFGSKEPFGPEGSTFVTPSGESIIVHYKTDAELAAERAKLPTFTLSPELQKGLEHQAKLGQIQANYGIGGGSVNINAPKPETIDMFGGLKENIAKIQASPYVQALEAGVVLSNPILWPAAVSYLKTTRPEEYQALKTELGKTFEESLSKIAKPIEATGKFLGEKVITPAYEGVIKPVGAFGYEYVVKPAVQLEAAKLALEAQAAKEGYEHLLKPGYEKIVVPAGKAIGEGVEWLGKEVVVPVGTAYVGMELAKIKAAQEAGKFTYENILKPAGEFTYKNILVPAAEQKVREAEMLAKLGVGAYQSIIKPAGEFAFENILKPYAEMKVKQAETTAALAVGAYEKGIKPASIWTYEEALKPAAGGTYEYVLKPIGGGVKTWWEAPGGMLILNPIRLGQVILVGRPEDQKAKGDTWEGVVGLLGSGVASLKYDDWAQGKTQTNPYTGEVYRMKFVQNGILDTEGHWEYETVVPAGPEREKLKKEEAKAFEKRFETLEQIGTVVPYVAPFAAGAIALTKGPEFIDIWLKGKEKGGGLGEAWKEAGLPLVSAGLAFAGPYVAGSKLTGEAAKAGGSILRIPGWSTVTGVGKAVVGKTTWANVGATYLTRPDIYGKGAQTFIAVVGSPGGQEVMKEVSEKARTKIEKERELLIANPELDQYKKQIQTDFDNKYATDINAGTITYEQARDEFMASDTYKKDIEVLQKESNKYQTWVSGAKLAGLQLVDIFTPETPGQVMLFATAPAIWKMIPTYPRIGIETYLATTETPKFFNPNLPKEQRILGGAFGALSAIGAYHDVTTNTLWGRMAKYKVETYLSKSEVARKVFGFREPVQVGNVRVPTKEFKEYKEGMWQESAKTRGAIVPSDGNKVMVVENRADKQLLLAGGSPNPKDINPLRTGAREYLEETMGDSFKSLSKPQKLKLIKALEKKVSLKGVEVTGDVRTYVYELKVPNIDTYVKSLKAGSDVSAFKVVDLKSLTFKAPTAMSPYNQPVGFKKYTAPMTGYREDTTWILNKYFKELPTIKADIAALPISEKSRLYTEAVKWFKSPASPYRSKYYTTDLFTKNEIIEEFLLSKKGLSGFPVLTLGGKNKITDMYYNPRTKGWNAVARTESGQFKEQIAKWQSFKAESVNLEPGNYVMTYGKKGIQITHLDLGKESILGGPAKGELGRMTFSVSAVDPNVRHIEWVQSAQKGAGKTMIQALERISAGGQVTLTPASQEASLVNYYRRLGYKPTPSRYGVVEMTKKVPGYIQFQQEPIMIGVTGGSRYDVPFTQVKQYEGYPQAIGHGSPSAPTGMFEEGKFLARKPSRGQYFYTQPPVVPGVRWSPQYLGTTYLDIGKSAEYPVISFRTGKKAFVQFYEPIGKITPEAAVTPVKGFTPTTKTLPKGGGPYITELEYGTAAVKSPALTTEMQLVSGKGLLRLSYGSGPKVAFLGGYSVGLPYAKVVPGIVKESAFQKAIETLGGEIFGGPSLKTAAISYIPITGLASSAALLVKEPTRPVITPSRPTPPEVIIEPPKIDTGTEGGGGEGGGEGGGGEGGGGGGGGSKPTPPEIIEPPIIPEIPSKPEIPRIPERPRIPETPGIPEFPRVPLLYAGARKKKEKEKKKPKVIRGYQVLVRRRRKFRIESPFALPKEEALKFGIKRTLGTAAATFKLVPTEERARTLGLPAPSAREMQYFRAPKTRVPQPLTYVQKERQRIVTAGEKREITYPGIRAAAARSTVPKVRGNLFSKKQKGGRQKWF